MKKKIQNDSRETVSLGFRYLTVYLFKQIHPLCLRGCVGVFSLATIFILSSVHTTVTAGGWESSSSLTLFSTAGSADCVLTVQGCCFFAAVSGCPALIAAPFCRCQSTESAGASVNCGCLLLIQSFHIFCIEPLSSHLLSSQCFISFVVSGLAHISLVSPISMIDLTWLTCSEVV